MNRDESALARLARAYPEAYKAEVGRTRPFYEVSSKKSVLNHFHNATNNTMGRAIMLAVMLDQFESGEVVVQTAARESAAEIFEEAFNELACA